MRLGEITPSYDAETEVVERRPWEHLTDEELERVRRQFVGEIVQQVPAYSAVKVKGKRLYEQARAGKKVERPSRRVQIYAFELLGRKGPDVAFRVCCSKGTYIRSLVHDFGQVLGCGAHLIELRRTRSGPYRVEQAWTLEALAEALQARTSSQPERSHEVRTRPGTGRARRALGRDRRNVRRGAPGASGRVAVSDGAGARAQRRQHGAQLRSASTRSVARRTGIATDDDRRTGYAAGSAGHRALYRAVFYAGAGGHAGPAVYRGNPRAPHRPAGHLRGLRPHVRSQSGRERSPATATGTAVRICRRCHSTAGGGRPYGLVHADPDHSAA